MAFNFWIYLLNEALKPNISKTTKIMLTTKWKFYVILNWESKSILDRFKSFENENIKENDFENPISCIWIPRIENPSCTTSQKT